MLQVNPLYIVIGLEAFGVVLVLFAATTFLALRRRAKDRRAMKRLVSGIKEKSEARLADTRALLESTFGLEGEELDDKAKEVNRRERQVLQLFIKLYRSRDAKTAARFDEVLVKLLEPFGDLTATPAETGAAPDAEPGPAGDAGIEPERGESGDDRVATLEAENVKLTEELQATKQAMDNMLSEYASMFARDGEDGPGAGDAAGESVPADAGGAPAEPESTGDAISVERTEEPAGPSAELPARASAG